MIYNTIYPITSYLISGLPLLLSALIWQTWFIIYWKYNLNNNFICKNLFSSFATWIMFVVLNHLIIGTKLDIIKWFGNEPCLFKFTGKKKINNKLLILNY
jgi:hypothetical protein